MAHHKDGGLANIRAALIRDVEMMTDEEILDELVEMGEDPDAILEKMRASIHALVGDELTKE